MPVDLVEVRFKGQRKEVFANPQQFPFRVGDYALVQADRGQDLGQIHRVGPLLQMKAEDEKELKEVVRMANKEELEQFSQNRKREREAFETCRRKVKKLGLGMRLVDCEFQLDGRKITIFFTADKRIDFRKLVKIMAGKYKTRIEFRQIGAREGSRRLGGYGVCGRTLCCSSWISEFSPVTTQAAKEQNLPLNASKLAGVCGRLKCCLMFERDFYNQAIAEYPQLAKSIVTEKGDGIVDNIDIFNEEVTIKYPDDSTETYSLDYIKSRVYQCENGCEPVYGNFEQLN